MNKKHRIATIDIKLPANNSVVLVSTKVIHDSGICG